MLPETPETQLNECPNSWVTVRLQAKVFCIDFFESQQVCFKLTPGTIQTLIEHHRSVYCENFGAQCVVNAVIEAETKRLMSLFELTVDSFVLNDNCRYMGRK